MDKELLLKVARDVREQGVTVASSRELLKKASDMRIISLLAVIKK